MVILSTCVEKKQKTDEPSVRIWHNNLGQETFPAYPPFGSDRGHLIPVDGVGGGEPTRGRSMAKWSVGERI